MIRWKNAIIYLLLQFLVYIFLEPLDKKIFWTIVLAFLFLGMAMNIQNNILDKEIDRHKAEFRDFDSHLYKRLSYFFLLLFLISLLYAYASIYLFLTALFSAILLWLYNRYFKKTPFYGNFLVALVLAVSVVLPGWSAGFETEEKYFVLMFLALYAFLLNLKRELIKDMEDLKPDEKAGYRTLAILDLQMAQRYAVALSIVLLGVLFLIKSRLSPVSFWSLFVLTLWFTSLSSFYMKKNEYGKAASILKWNMLIGFILILTGLKM